MENMEDRIMDILNDPQKMEQVAEMAQKLGLPNPSGDGEIPPALGALLQNSGGDNRQQALIQALLPYLRPNRQKKLRRAVELARLSHVAGFALQNYAKESEGGGV